MKSISKCFALGVMLACLPPSLAAETAYVIDKLLVGVHTDKTLESPIIKVFPTGTQLEVLKREGELAQVKGPDNVTGWVDASYLTNEQPAAAVLELLEAQNRQLVENLKTVEAKAAELEARQGKQSAAGDTKPNEQAGKLLKENEDLKQALTAERARTGVLQGKLTEMQKQAQNPPQDASGAAADAGIREALRQENEELKQALAEADSTPAEEPRPLADLTAWMPELPEAFTEGVKVFGEWVLSPLALAGIAMVLLVASFAGGAYFMDRLQRRRHGGFRL